MYILRFTQESDHITYQHVYNIKVDLYILYTEVINMHVCVFTYGHVKYTNDHNLIDVFGTHLKPSGCKTSDVTGFITIVRGPNI